MRVILLGVLVSAWLLVPVSSRAQGPALGSTLQLSARIENEGAIHFNVSSPYAAREFRIEALSPTGRPFVIASGATGAQGAGAVGVRVRSADALVGLNATFQARLASGGEPQREAASRRIHLELGRNDSGESWQGFRRHDGIAEAIDPGSLAAAELGDLDADGDADLVVLASFGSGAARLGVLVNDGKGGFEDATASSVHGGTDAAGRTIALGDANADGAIDVFVGTGESQVENVLYLNDGSGILAAAAGLPLKAEGARCNAAVFADVDADGDLDLVLANGISGSHGVAAVPQPAQLLFNDGTGAFTASPDFEALAGPSVGRAVAAGDVDADGDLDVILGTSLDDKLLVNDGRGVFEDRSDRLPPAADSTFGVALADIDLDGDLDALLANTMFNPAAQVLLINQGGQQGGEAGSFAAGAFPRLAAGQSPVRLGLQLADVDADGDVDVLFAVHELGNAERPDLYINQGGRQGGESGTFVLDRSFEPSPGIYTAFPAGDLDGDGDLDILAFSSGTSAPESAAEAYFLDNQLFESTDAPLGFQRGDVNGDFARDLSDALTILGYLYLGTDAPPCLAAADVDDNDRLELTDAVALLGYLYLGERPPAAPFPGFGDDPTPGQASCDRVLIFTALR
jgi:hypothetical protein